MNRLNTLETTTPEIQYDVTMHTQMREVVASLRHHLGRVAIVLDIPNGVQSDVPDT